MYNIEAKKLGNFDVAVCGGGIAGVCAAVAAARNGANVILIESSGCLGGTMTEGLMPFVIDRDNKGGIIKEMFDFLAEHNMSCPRRGKKVDEQGRHLPGNLLDVEGAKYFFDKICADAGVKVLFHSRVTYADHNNGHINSILLSTECGNYSLVAKVYIDATGNGTLADMVGCQWECGDPEQGRPSPLSMGASAVGLPEDYDGTDSEEAKTEYANKLESQGIRVSAQQASIVKLPALKIWDLGFNFQYDVLPDNIEALSDAVYESRKEVFEVAEAHKKIPGFENMYLSATSSHIGVREGRRVFGVYRLTNKDILEGRRFDDGICLVTFHVDVHKLSADDTIETTRGYKSKPYHIPYRCLLPLGSDNMLLAGRCISGDFYPHASYRVMGNMAGTGEAAGYAAAVCVRDDIMPAEVDGKAVSAYMRPYLQEV